MADLPLRDWDTERLCARLAEGDDGPAGDEAIRRLRRDAKLREYLYACAVAGKAPEVRAVVNVEGDAAAVFFGDGHRLFLRGCRVGA